jgi:6-phosphogluconolactonase (cycloisomerase 2 family)
VFVANAGSGTIGTYRVLPDGTLAFLRNTSAGTGAKPLDVSVSSDGQDLYVLDGNNDQIASSHAAGAAGRSLTQCSPEAIKDVGDVARSSCQRSRLGP